MSTNVLIGLCVLFFSLMNSFKTIFPEKSFERKHTIFKEKL